jgi:starch phosphorylase
MSIIEEGSPQCIRMAYLAVVGSHTVNGVAALHSDLVKNNLFSEFTEFFGESRFTNVTNGVTPRRWLHQSNPQLSILITETLKSQDWLKDLSLLAGLKKYADDPKFQEQWMAIKYANKKRLADHIAQSCNVHVRPEALFDVQVKQFLI